MFLTGVLQAGIVLLLTAVFNVYIRVGVLLYDLQGILFTCITIISASFVLLFYSGPGRLGLSSFKNWATWGYGFCNIIQYVLDIYLSKYVSATELSLFSRLTIPLSIIIAFLFLKRTPSKMDIFSVLVIILGSVILFSLQDAFYLKTIVMLVGLAAVFFAAEMFFAETHTQSAEANENGCMKDRARVVGFASFVTSIMFLTMAIGCSLIKEYLKLDNTFIQALPSLSSYTHFPTIISGILYGSIIASVARFFTWSATYKIKTENVLAILVLVPITTYLLELLVSNIFNLEINSNMFAGDRGFWVFFALVLMTVGSMLSIIPKTLKNINKQKGQSWYAAIKDSAEKQDNNYEIQHDAFDSSDSEILEQTLAFFDNDYQKVANLYDINTDAIKVIIASAGNSCFIDDVSKKVQKTYLEEVVLKDKLTKAKNRLSLTKDVADLISKNKKFTLALLDLNDFKPVNDTYGHDAGDLVLVKTVERLESVYPNSVYRLGGDEFIMVVESNLAIDKVKEAVSKKMKYENRFIKISTSVGVAKYDKDGANLEDLLSSADTEVYKDKSTK